VVQPSRQLRNAAQQFPLHCADAASQASPQAVHSVASQVSQGGTVLCPQPVATAHASSVQVMWSLQSRVLPLAQAPATQWSPTVQALPSMHSVPSGLGWPEQVPVAGLQAAVSHWSPALQVTGVAPRQSPDWQESVCVQAF
jgi:hypothetical protein